MPSPSSSLAHSRALWQTVRCSIWYLDESLEYPSHSSVQTLTCSPVLTHALTHSSQKYWLLVRQTAQRTSPLERFTTDMMGGLSEA
jgi:hypothetical protein